MLEGNSINSAYAWLGYPISIGCVEFKINTNEHFNTEFKATTNHFDSDPGHSVYSANAGVNVNSFRMCGTISNTDTCIGERER